jgi:hypothetical protein
MALQLWRPTATLRMARSVALCRLPDYAAWNGFWRFLLAYDDGRRGIIRSSLPNGIHANPGERNDNSHIGRRSITASA